MIRHYVPAWRVVIERYYALVVFNFLFAGDAHLKNFPLIESENGDYLLSPAYDLLNTRLYVDDTDFALDKGLFADGYQSDVFKRMGHPGLTDFVTFGQRIGVSGKRIGKLLVPFQTRQGRVEQLISNSFLSGAGQRAYLLDYNRQRNYLNQ